jgi:hypothetical protein
MKHSADCHQINGMVIVFLILPLGSGTQSRHEIESNNTLGKV